MAALLADHPGLVGALDEDDRRRLVDAAQDENEAGVRLMLAAGWPSDARGQHGATALHWAAFHGDAAMVREILHHQPPLSARDDDHGGTPLAWARYGAEHWGHPQRGDHEAVVAALLEAGAAP